jgi:peptidoglycan/LPS O-acetylase OafA/YrhL
VVFYLLAPRLYKLETAHLLLIECGSILLRLGLILTGFTNDPWSYRSMLTEAIFFIFGILLYRNRMQMLKIVISNSRILHRLLISLYFVFTGIESAMSRFFELTVLMVITTNILLLQKTQNKVQNFLGQLSHPIYISHLLVLSSVEIFLNTTKEKPSNYIFVTRELIIWKTLFGTIALSVYLVKFTQPIESYRNRLRDKFSNAYCKALISASTISSASSFQ